MTTSQGLRISRGVLITLMVPKTRSTIWVSIRVSYLGGIPPPQGHNVFISSKVVIFRFDVPNIPL